MPKLRIGRRYILAACTLILSAAIASPAPASRKVILVSIDGLRPEFYRDTRWPMPTLRMIARRGATAVRVRGVYPSVTYPSHTTLVTGALPARHGIYYNAPFEPKGKTGAWYWYAVDIKVPTLWDVSRAAGLKTVALSWPVSVGAPVDDLLPEIWPLDEHTDALTLLRNHSHPRSLLSELEGQATGRLPSDLLSLDRLDRDLTFARFAAYLIRTRKPDLFAIHFVELDHFQHQEGRQGLDVERAAAAVDGGLSIMCQALLDSHLDDATTWVITGDHGFINIRQRLAPNVWLKQAGVLQTMPGNGPWKAVFHMTGASAFLHLHDPKDTATLHMVQALLDRLPDHYKALFHVLNRDRLKQLAAAPEAALALDPVPGVDFTDRADVPVLTPAHGGQHGYRMQTADIFTGLAAAGPGIRRGARVVELPMQDIAPLVAHLLEVRLPAADGKLPAALLDDSASGGVCDTRQP